METKILKDTIPTKGPNPKKKTTVEQDIEGDKREVVPLIDREVNPEQKIVKGDIEDYRKR